MSEMPAALELPTGLVMDEDRDLAGGLSTAVMDEARTYRYLLTRIWDAGTPPMVWIMLNPSTADHRDDDPTSRRCVSFARREGCGGIAIVNLFALRSTDPRALKDHTDPVGEHNDSFLRHATAGPGPGPVVAAWGVGGVLRDRAQAVTASLTAAGVQLRALGTTSTEQPKHPLYLAAAAPLVEYAGPGLPGVAA